LGIGDWELGIGNKLLLIHYSSLSIFNEHNG